MSEVRQLTDVSWSEAEAIAVEVDPQAGGFFKRMLVLAAMKGAQAQRLKLAKHGESEAHKEEEINGGFAELREQFHDVP